MIQLHSHLWPSSNTKVIGGWADISNSTGAGMEIGIDQMSGMWPASLEFNNGAADTRIGLFSGKNSKNIYMPWPHWKVFETFLNFHASSPASLSNDYLKFQHFLVARPAIDYINTTAVFPYPILDPNVEDSYYVTTAQTATPALQLSISAMPAEPLTAHRTAE
jgi:hypothetical protein